MKEGWIMTRGRGGRHANHIYGDKTGAALGGGGLPRAAGLSPPSVESLIKLGEI